MGEIFTIIQKMQEFKKGKKISLKKTEKHTYWEKLKLIDFNYKINKKLFFILC
jgi:hypothetical protein